MDENIVIQTFEKARYEGLVKSKTEFAALLGVNYASLLQAMKGDPRYLTQSFITKMNWAVEQAASKNPDIQMERIPLLPVEARGGSLADWSESVQSYDCETIVSPVKGATFAMQIYGDSMAPEYPSGSQVLIKKIDPSEFIEWGKAYVLDTPNGAVIKQLFPGILPTEVKCVSINKDYPPFEIRKDFVLGWYRVLMCMSLK